jgi:hypothetical protein
MLQHAFNAMSHVQRQLVKQKVQALLALHPLCVSLLAATMERFEMQA